MTTDGLYFDYSDGTGQAKFDGGYLGDVLIGGSGADDLKGMGGDDTLAGGAGADILTGGAGNDTFSGTASELDGDTITDFSGGDRIQLTGGGTFQSVSVLPGGTTLQYVVSDTTYSINLTAPVSALTYTDNEISIGQPDISIADVTQAEGQSGTTNFTFTASLDVRSTEDTTFDYSVSHGTTDASDFNGALSGSGTIAAGQLFTTINIEVVGDRVVEPDETFFVNLSKVAGATLADSQALGTIQNDDSPPNAAPRFIGPTDLSIGENQFVIAALAATDPDGDALSYTLAGGDDATLFSIDAKTGELSFIHAPDFEAPGSAAGSNEYQVRVEVSDGSRHASDLFHVSVTDANDEIVGTPGNDVFHATDAFEHFHGGDGHDTVVFSGAHNAYTIEVQPNGTVTVANGNGIDTLESIERLQFDDGMLAFDADGNAGQMLRLYQAAFGRDPDAEGLGYWVRHQDAGESSFQDVARSFMASPEFEQRYGSESSLSNTAFLDLLYQNVLGREPDADGFAYWINKLDTGQTDHGDLLAFFSDSNENVAGTADAVNDGIWFV